MGYTARANAAAFGLWPLVMLRIWWGALAPRKGG